MTMKSHSQPSVTVLSSTKPHWHSWYGATMYSSVDCLSPRSLLFYKQILTYTKWCYVCNLAPHKIPDCAVKLPIPGLGKREVGGAKVQRLEEQKDHGREKYRREGRRKEQLSLTRNTRSRGPCCKVWQVGEKQPKWSICMYLCKFWMGCVR